MADTAGWRERVEETALLWVLVAIVAILSLLPLARLLFEGVAPNGRVFDRRARQRPVEQRRPGPRRSTAW